MKSSKTPKMIIFSWPIIEKSFVKIFSGSSGISYWSKACSEISLLSIAPTLDRFGRVQLKNDTIEKRWRTMSSFIPKNKRTNVDMKNCTGQNSGFLSLFTIDDIFYVAFYCTARYQLKQNNYYVSLSNFEGITLLERRYQDISSRTEFAPRCSKMSHNVPLRITEVIGSHFRA